MATIHPFARSPVRDNGPTPPNFPGGFADNDRDIREEEDYALRMMAYGEQDVVRDRRGQGSRSDEHNEVEAHKPFKRGTRSPPPQGPPR
jgi:hypothetical protein